MEYVNCNLCRSKEKHLIFELKNKYTPIGERLNIVKCNNCGLVYLNSRHHLEEIKKYYPQEYFPRLNIKRVDERDKNRLDIKCKNRLKEILYLKKSGKVLDIGCGDGYFLNYLKQNGWQVNGIEISEFAARKIKEKYDIDIFCGELSQAGYPDEYFDVVSLFEVLEHLPDPAEALLEVQRIIKKTGLLIMTVPNFDSLQRLLFGKYWHIIDPPRHLFYFSRTTIDTILKKCNFGLFTIKAIDGARVLDIKTTTGYSESIRSIFKNSSLSSSERMGCNKVLLSIDREKSMFLKEFLHRFEAVVFLFPALIAKILSREDTLLIKAIK